MRRSEITIDLDAVRHNVRRLLDAAAGAEVWAVVKADGYGHGAVPVARAAKDGGARWLAVAAAGEALALREAGLSGRILVMGAISEGEVEVARRADADVVAWREEFVARLAAAGSLRVHVKLDTGMGRLGTRDPGEAGRVADRVASEPALELAGVMTHFATADDCEDRFLHEQLGRFQRWVGPMRDRHAGLVAHAANSAAVLRERASHFDLVRCGISIYGMDPYGSDPAARALEPALSLTSYVAAVKDAAPGDSAGYGRRFVAERPTRLGVLPIGYGDGWRRGLTNNADVLVGGRRHALVGTVSMDNVTIDLGPGSEVPAGAEAVLIGSQGAEAITAEEVARRLHTINYEVTCGLLPRVARVYHHDGVPAHPDGRPGSGGAG